MKKMMELAKNEHIIVQPADFPYPLRGIYIDDGKLKMIGIAKDIETLAERRSVFAEELGHHFTSVGNATVCHCYVDRIFIDKTERKAMVWAGHYLVPERDLDDAVKQGHVSLWDLADYFTVTEKFMAFCVKMYKGD